MDLISRQLLPSGGDVRVYQYMKLVLMGVPPTLNTNVRHGGGHHYKTKKYTDWETEMLWQIKDQVHNRGDTKGQTIPEPPVKILFDWFPPDNRRRDLDNITKPVLDLLQKAEIIPDDNWQTIRWLLLFCQGIDKDLPRVEVSLSHHVARQD